jgi:SAM-dependent methyltransferase
MAEGPATWVGNNFAHDAELFRLRAIERVFDERTRKLLDRRCGVQTGWRCLELGAGAGSIARWLAERVGPSGSVVAVDINCRFLTDLPPNVEVRELDIASADFGVDDFDVVHHRAVLAYASGHHEVLARVAASLRHGRWWLSEEPLFNEIVLAGDSDAGLLARWFKALSSILEASGTDLLLGASLPFVLEGIGLSNVGHEATVQIAQGGDGNSDIYWPLVDGLRSQLATVAGFADADLDRLVQLLRSPESRWVSVTLISAWGCRPAE